jgi:polyhydroxyalkanoate synthesis regulator phasin
MSKKSFKGGLNSLLGDTLPEGELNLETGKGFIDELKKTTEDKPRRGRPVTQTKKITKSSQEGTKENETRATFIINEELLDKLKAIAYWDRLLIKDVINSALQEAVFKYEKKSGAIKPTPKK